MLARQLTHILIPLALSAISGGCAMPHAMKAPFVSQVNDEFTHQPLKPLEMLTADDVSRLPKAVQRYLGYVGAIGKPKVQNFRVVFDIEMKKNPEARPMIGWSEQYNFLGDPTRLFYMKAKMFGIPADGLHSYRREKASMIVRVASLFNVVDASGPVMDQTDTVTLLNDICIMSPSALADPRFTYQELDDTRTQVTYRNGQIQVSAILYFGKDGELVNFTSEDRSALQDDGTFRKLKFSTPLREYRDFNGYRLASYGEAVWHYPEGEFAYGKFRMKDVRYNVPGPAFQSE